MILQHDRDTRSKRGKSQYFPRKTETMDVKDVGRQPVNQVAEIPTADNCCRTEAGRQKVIGNSTTLQSFGTCASLDDGYTRPGLACSLSDVGKSRPVMEQLRRIPALRIKIETDLGNV